MDDLTASLNKAYTANVRQSFFGGVVSTRLQSQNLNKVIPQNVDRLHMLKQRKESRVSSGSAGTRRPSQTKPKLTAAEQKTHQRRQLEEKRRRMQARIHAQMQSEVGDKFVPEVHGAAAVKKPKQDPAAATAPAPKKAKADPRSPAVAAGQTAKTSSGTAIKRMTPQGLPSKPVEKRLSSGQKVMIHNSVPKPRKLGVPKPTPAKPAGPSKPAAKPSRPGFPSKACRSCREDKPLTDFYADKRLPDGATHMCGICAKKKGLSGRLLTREEVMALFPAAAKGSSSAAQSRSGASPTGARPMRPPQASGACAAGSPQAKHVLPPSRMMTGNGRFYGNSAPRSAAASGRYGGRMARSQLDEYEDDFVVEDEEEDWRHHLSQVTRGYYRERHDDHLGSDRMMEASAADIRREEARSKRIGRQEDLEAEAEENARIRAKQKRALKKTKPRKKKKRRTGVSSLIADEASESDSEEEDDEDYD